VLKDNTDSFKGNMGAALPGQPNIMWSMEIAIAIGIGIDDMFERHRLTNAKDNVSGSTIF
jgi:hypothetical protein